ncbi:MAG TPA: cbb3-type cytochrome c oxidase N-terminal domain-containing protein [Saprospiraceae bacterium]|nr:cbb3-type cytochrome c oxidase N-terminal domain-containing protein [Saprospiraceae bacterium]
MKTLIALSLIFFSAMASGQTGNAPAVPPTSAPAFDINIILIILAVFLLLPISSLGKAFVAAAKKKLEENAKSASLKVLIPLAIILVSQAAQAQAAVAVPDTGAGVNSQTMTITLLCAIGLEIIIMVFLAFRVSDMVQSNEAKQVQHTYEYSPLKRIQKLFTKANFRPIEEEGQIDLGHNYDGIRELDNVIPPWFTTAFLLTILFAGVYLYRYHIAKSAPLQIEEYKMALAKANAEHDAYLATQANAIDENSVTIMTGAEIELGKRIFTTTCAACHRADGGGQVGPNLTDEYWIHGGSLKDVFKTIKYGVPDKGMISWKEQLSPSQMAQVANYILTLKGTNPPDPKEKQGTLYVAETVRADTSSALSSIVKDTSAMN